MEYWMSYSIDELDRIEKEMQSIVDAKQLDLDLILGIIGDIKIEREGRKA